MTGNQSWIVMVLSLLGVQVSGDVDGLTVYTNRRGKIVFYPITSPEKPPSALQLQQRNRFRMAQQNWKLESTATKRNWELLVKRNYLVATGQNLYISASLDPNANALVIMQRRAGISVTTPAYIPW